MDQFVGLINAFGFNFAPSGWLTCSGQYLPIQQYTVVFALLGTYYGGNGTTTFALPNLNGSVALGMGQGSGLSNYDIGETGGQDTVTLSILNMPAHNHTLNVAIKANNAGAGTDSPVNNFPAGDGGGENYYAPASQQGTLMAPITATIYPTSGSNPIDIRRPYVAMTYCIAVTGVYPSRS